MSHSAETIKAHGLTPIEYQSVVSHLGREPNLLELGIFSVLWSEHCSYKSSRKYLKQFPTTGPNVLVGPGENAGVVSIGDGDAVAFKMESHNHPSYIEPYQGAATGVGGILRDVFTMGARPIAMLNSLRFGDPKHPKTPWLVNGVVAGIAGYGNCIGVPTVGGEVFFDASYNGNCLVNAFALGVLKADKIFKGTAAGAGNPILYVGSKTGRDGIHGATMASAEFDEKSDEKRPTVQVGDPFTEKLLLEACLELFETDALIGIQDMGAAGLTSSSIEMAGRGGSGIELDLSLVPRRESRMTPYEIMLSESQERMVLVTKQGRQDEVLNIFRKWDLDAAVIGSVTNTGRVVLRDGAEIVADIPVKPLTEGAPIYDRPTRRPAKLDALQSFDVDKVAAPKDLGADLLRLLGRPNIANKAWVYRQYDHQVRLGGIVLPGRADAAVVRVERTNKGIAIATDCNPRFVFLDPYQGAKLAVAECTRNVSCVGGEPLGLTDCLNFGNPERPEIMWQFAEATRGLADACRELQVPVVSGNVSLYNETDGQAIFPTPSVAVVGLVADVTKTCSMAFKNPGDVIAILGTTVGQLGGSEWLTMTTQKTVGKPPSIDLRLELKLQQMLRNLISTQMLSSAHDCAEGGLAVALSECCVGGSSMIGAHLDIGSHKYNTHQFWFGEDATRAIISFNPVKLNAIKKMSTASGVPFEVIGKVGGTHLNAHSSFNVPVDELSRAWKSGFESALGLSSS